MPDDLAVDENLPKEALVDFCQRNGCMRTVDAKRRTDEGPNYRKGYEIRLVGRNRKELYLIRRLLKRARLKGGKPHRNSNQWVQPIYGKAAVETFQTSLDSHE